MTLRHIQIFKTVCREGSITGAADKLGMTQPAVSIAVGELEAYYRVKLFERMNRRLYITEAGSTLLQYADTITTQFDESAEVLRSGRLFKRCIFGVNITYGETRLPAIAKRIRDENPGIELTVHVDNSYAIEKMLAANELDFAVINDPATARDWETVELFTERMEAYCAEGYLQKGALLTVSQLAREKLLLREKGSGSRACVDALMRRHGVKPLAALQSISTKALIDMAAAGMGIAILPAEVVKTELEKGLLVRAGIADDSFTRQYRLIYNRHKYISDTVKAVIRLVSEDANAERQG